MSNYVMPEGKTLTDVHHDNAVMRAEIARDEAFQKKSDEHFRRTHPGLRNGRNFLWDVMRHRDFGDTFGEKFDQTFKGCVGSDKWFDDNFCPRCDKRRNFCECDGSN
uniref:Uncharacterized protein n=1 Tax=viral metagenome TaxID=1070528 RepID=A0A6M3IF17_9ZZZZ